MYQHKHIHDENFQKCHKLDHQLYTMLDHLSHQQLEHTSKRQKNRLVISLSNFGIEHDVIWHKSLLESTNATFPQVCPYFLVERIRGKWSRIIPALWKIPLKISKLIVQLIYCRVTHFIKSALVLLTCNFMLFAE